MNRRALNLIAGVCFVIAAVAFYVTGPLWLGILFTVLALISVYQLLSDRR